MVSLQIERARLGFVAGQRAAGAAEHRLVVDDRFAIEDDLRAIEQGDSDTSLR
jgi:hypothetical protein